MKVYAIVITALVALGGAADPYSHCYLPGCWGCSKQYCSEDAGTCVYNIFVCLFLLCTNFGDNRADDICLIHSNSSAAPTRSA